MQMQTKDSQYNELLIFRKYRQHIKQIGKLKIKIDNIFLMNQLIY